MKTTLVGLLLASSIVAPLLAFAQLSDPNANRIFAHEGAKHASPATARTASHFSDVSEAVAHLNRAKPQSELWEWAGTCTDAWIKPKGNFVDCSASHRITLLKGGTGGDIVALSASQESGNECFELLAFDGLRWVSVGNKLFHDFGTVFEPNYGMKAGTQDVQPSVIVNYKTKREYRYVNGKFTPA